MSVVSGKANGSILKKLVYTLYVIAKVLLVKKKMNETIIFWPKFVSVQFFQSNMNNYFKRYSNPLSLLNYIWENTLAQLFDRQF